MPPNKCNCNLASCNTCTTNNLKELWAEPEFLAWNLQRESQWFSELESMSEDQWQAMCQTLPQTLQN